MVILLRIALHWVGRIYIYNYKGMGVHGVLRLPACTSIYSLRHLRLTVWVCGIDIISGSSTVIPYCSVCNSMCYYSFMLLLPGSVRHSVCAYSVRFTTGPNNQRHIQQRVMSMRSLFLCFATESITDNPAPLTTKKQNLSTGTIEYYAKMSVKWASISLAFHRCRELY